MSLFGPKGVRLERFHCTSLSFLLRGSEDCRKEVSVQDINNVLTIKTSAL